MDTRTVSHPGLTARLPGTRGVPLGKTAFSLSGIIEFPGRVTRFVGHMERPSLRELLDLVDGFPMTYPADPERLIVDLLTEEDVDVLAMSGAPKGREASLFEYFKGFSTEVCIGTDRPLVVGLHVVRRGDVFSCYADLSWPTVQDYRSSVGLAGSDLVVLIGSTAQVTESGGTRRLVGVDEGTRVSCISLD